MTCATWTTPLLDLLFDDPGVGRCVVAPDGSVLRANAEWLRSTGRTLDDTVGADLVELLPAPRDVALAVGARARAGHRVEIPRHARRVEGRETWWEGSIDPVPMERGTGLLIKVREVGRPSLGVGVDDRCGGATLDERCRRVVEALRESEEKLRLLANAMPQIVCVLAPDGTPEYVNPGWVEFSGRDVEATRSAGWEGTIHPDDVPAARDCRRRVVKRLASEDVELRYRAADGTFRWFHSRLAPVVERGRVVRFVGAAMDIEARKRAEEASARNHEMLSRVIERLPVMIAMYEPRLGAFRFNDELKRVLGWTEEDAASGDLLARACPDPQARAQAVEHLSSPGTGWRELAVTAKDGSVVPSSWANLHLRDDTQVGIGIDLRDRKRAEAALREADRRKDEFLGMLSHELRNPLAPIRNSVYILRHAPPGGEQARRASDVIERQAEHLTRLVDDLLDVTRVARGKIELRRSRIDLREIVLHSADDFRLTLEDRGVALRHVLPDAKVWVEADGTRITQVVGNLLHNAAKFTGSGDEVTVSLAIASGAAEIRVRDTGAGIEPALLPHLFEPFVQGARTLARTEGGLGLGLALVKGIAELHGGTVRVDSAGRGEGAEFVVRLPLGEGAPHREAVRPPAPTRSRGRRALIVDDNADAAHSLAEIVEMFGYQAEIAYDGPSAIEKARANPPTIVLCDIGLPGMSGYEVAQVLRRSGDGMQLFAVSGYAQPEDVRSAIEAGFDGHLAKPVDPERIERLLA